MNKTTNCNLNVFFTRSMLAKIVKREENIIYNEVVEKYVENPCGKNNLEIIKDVYSVLKKSYRNEYYYKNTLLNKLLLGVHSINTTTALTEVSISDSKADFVLINGKAVVYEIKTELDNLERLSNQICDYYKAFDHVAVVTYEKNVERVQDVIDKLAKPVGIYVLKKNNQLKTVKRPEKYSKDLDRNSLFKILRKKEYEEIIYKYYKELPQVDQFQYYRYCNKMFIHIPLEFSYPLILEILKRRVNVQKDDFAKSPYEIKFLAYFNELKTKDYVSINSFLESQYGGV